MTAQWEAMIAADSAHYQCAENYQTTTLGLLYGNITTAFTVRTQEEEHVESTKRGVKTTQAFSLNMECLTRAMWTTTLRAKVLQ